MSLFLTGQTFLGFQWDIALLETSFLALLFCPVGGLRCGEDARPPANFVLRVFFAKFMMMTGHVKVRTAGGT